MNPDLSALTISATKPNRKPAAMLAQLGIRIVPIEEDEGDVDRYILSKRVAVERRTGGGFLKGIMDKTLFTSAIYLRERFRVPILIVEGKVNYEYTRFDPQAVRGAMTAMMLEYGVSVLSAPDIEETVQLIAMIARQEQLGIPVISLIPKRKATSLPDMQRRMIEMLPGCGMVMARNLLQYFGSVRRTLNATTDELRGVPGIAAKKATEMHKVLNAEYEAVDTERNLEDAIEADHALLFERRVVLLARQHHIYTEHKERHIVDMVFLDPDADELFLIELKRGALTLEHYRQLRRYLDNAGKSKLLGPFLDSGVRISGVLATVERCKFRPQDPEVSVRIVDIKRVINVLKQQRRRRLDELPAGGE